MRVAGKMSASLLIYENAEGIVGGIFLTTKNSVQSNLPDLN
jgi:hypothetical protein